MAEFASYLAKAILVSEKDVKGKENARVYAAALLAKTFVF